MSSISGPGASELLEAGRAIQRGLVTPDRTTLIASSHRSYTIAEKSALGQGTADAAELAALAQTHGKRLILFDMEAIAEQQHSVISSVLLGALCGAGVLPFPREDFETAIRKKGIAVATNLSAFADACQRAQSEPAPPRAHPAPPTPQIPIRALTPALQPLLDQVWGLPLPAQGLAFEGVRRMLDYQDPPYAELYLSRLERIAALEGSGLLTAAVARSLAL